MAEAKSRRSVKTTLTTETKPGGEDVVKVVEEDQGFSKFLWNSDKGEVLGRTFSSWLLITIFYGIFFFALFCFFVLSWFISLSMVSPTTPYRRGSSSILGYAGPGLTYRPEPDTSSNAVSSLIWFGTGSYDDYSYWSEQLNVWFSNIPKMGDKMVGKCFDKVKFNEEIMLKNTTTSNKDLSCLVDLGWYGPCTHEKDKSFGFDRGEPCLLLKLNRIFDWTPVPLTWEDWEGVKGKDPHTFTSDLGVEVKVPPALINYIFDTTGGGGGSGPTNPTGSSTEATVTEPTTGDGGSRRRKRQAEPTPAPPGEPSGDVTTEPNTGTGAVTQPPENLQTIAEDERKKLIASYVMFWCDGESDVDRESLGSFQYYPGPYLPAAYFPFTGQKNYQTPFIALQLKRPLPGSLIGIVCQAFAKNLDTARDTGVGYARFQVMVG